MVDSEINYRLFIVYYAIVVIYRLEYLAFDRHSPFTIHYSPFTIH